MNGAWPAAPASAAPTRAARELSGVVGLAVPLVAGLATSSLMGLIDTAMIGPLGVVPLAAVSLTSNVLVILVAGLYGFLNPVALRVGRAHGEGDPGAAAASVAAGLFWAVIAGGGAAVSMAAALPLLPALRQPPEVVAVVAPYWLACAASLLPLSVTLVYKQALDAIDRAWLGVLLASISLLANAAFNYVLIYGRFGLPALGLAGAGLGTFLACLLGAILHGAVCRNALALRARVTTRAVSSARARHRADGVPMGLQYVLEGGAVAVAGLLVGGLGAVALAATQVVNAVAGSLYMLPFGLSAAVGIRIAQASGAGQALRMRSIGVAGLGVVGAWTLLATLVLTLSARPIAAAFVDDGAVIGLAAGLFLVIGLMQVCDGVQSVSLGALRGMGDIRWPTGVSLVAYWLVALPLGWLSGFPLGWGAVGVWAGFGLGLAVAAAMLLRRFLRLTA
jgi:MATE family multidrug resistance protein